MAAKKRERLNFDQQLKENKQLLLGISGAILMLLFASFGARSDFFKNKRESKPIPNELTKNLSPIPTNITIDKAVETVRGLPEVQQYLSENPNRQIKFNGESADGKAWIVQVFEVNEGRLTATFNWYEVDKETLSVGKVFDIDTPSVNNACIITGCSGQVCANEEVVTTCEYNEIYSCFRSATCEVQSNGECGWTMNEGLNSCLQSYVGEPSI